MKKITKNNFSKQLAKYGALSLAIAGIADASGQIVYTDVDPDFVGGMTDSFAIDFNGDAIDDLSILQSNNGNYELVQALPAGGNGVLAASNAGYLYASNLAYGAVISAGAGAFGSFGSLCAGVGYAGSQFCGTGPGYIGVQFDIAGTTHYGWVRASAADSSNFSVLEFAYESTADTAILAGDMGVAGVEDQLFAGFNYFVNDNGLNLKANSSFEQVQMFNMLGQQVVSEKLASNNETVNIASLKAGIYVVTVTIDGASKSFKIAKN